MWEERTTDKWTSSQAYIPAHIITLRGRGRSGNNGPATALHCTAAAPGARQWTCKLMAARWQPGAPVSRQGQFYFHCLSTSALRIYTSRENNCIEIDRWNRCLFRSPVSIIYLNSQLVRHKTDWVISELDHIGCTPHHYSQAPEIRPRNVWN